MVTYKDENQPTVIHLSTNWVIYKRIFETGGKFAAVVDTFDFSYSMGSETGKR